MVGSLANEQNADAVRDRQRLKDEKRPRLEHFITMAENGGKVRRAGAFRWALDEMNNEDNLEPYRCLTHLKRFPVTIEQFVKDKEFLGVLDDFQVWPGWSGELKAMCPDVICGETPVHEIYLGGASGTGKTTLAWIVMAYQFYLLTCFDKPHDPFPNLASLTPIAFPLMSLNPTITKDVIYQPFRTLLTSMPYVRKNLKWDTNKDSALDFNNGVSFIPVAAMDTSLQGRGICGAILDEMAFMEVVESSKRVSGPRGLGGKFDQAELVHKAAVNRRNRSFKVRGVSIGTLCIMSNTRYQGDFMDRRLSVLENASRKNVYFRRLKRYELSPDDIADCRAGRTVRILVGTDYYASRILQEGETPPKNAMVEVIPQKYRDQATDDPEGVLREVCGISTGVIRPFIPQRDKIADAFERGKDMVPWVDEQDVDLSNRGLPVWVDENMPADRSAPLFIHIDLSKSHDRCGVSVIRVRGWVYVDDPENPNLREKAPYYEVAVAVSIQPNGEQQIDPFEIRTWLMKLGTEHGFQIRGVSYDGYQSAESIQRWRKAGSYAKEISVDRTTQPYAHFRNALYQNRVNIVPSEILRSELLELEHNVEKDKVDHPPKGSKDLSDAVAGAVFNASETRGVRGKSEYTTENGERARVRKTGDRKASERPRGAPRGGSAARSILRERREQSRNHRDDDLTKV